ncbi:flavodoxin [Ferrimonas lipolytica]|uniref:Flavodoxin n=1 Tax=Ferrimonas lipolytica TaxID=2724191 RepID=A0A6H1UKY1_9GAMM|nr:flavodoxin [Ferrimonas lipolytica]QIZ78886.1 flavodoxin [Ferrimonas lipolytica]
MLKIYFLVGSVYGGAEDVAEQLQPEIEKAGYAFEYLEQWEEATFSKLNGSNLLVVTSTTGSGDLPDNIAPLFQQLKDRFPLLPDSRYGVIALGDSSYGDTFCGAGRQFDELLQELGAQRVGELLQIDACETMEPEIPALKWLALWLTNLKEN